MRGESKLKVAGTSEDGVGKGTSAQPKGYFVGFGLPRGMVGWEARVVKLLTSTNDSVACVG